MESAWSAGRMPAFGVVPDLFRVFSCDFVVILLIAINRRLKDSNHEITLNNTK